MTARKKLCEYTKPFDIQSDFIVKKIECGTNHLCCLSPQIVQRFSVAPRECKMFAIRQILVPARSSSSSTTSTVPV